MPPIRNERLAVNLFDLDRIPPLIRGIMLKDKLDLSKTLNMDFSMLGGAASKTDVEFAVLFTCDLLTAAATCDHLRSNDRAGGDTPTRLYLLRKSWSRVSPNTVLTELRDGKLMLSPSAFPSALVAASQVAPTPKPLF